MKCSVECLYCKERCDLCLQRAGFGLSRDDCKLGELRFCSEECQLLSTGKKDELLIKDPYDSLHHPLSHTSAVFSDHRELLYVFAHCASPDGDSEFVYLDLTLAAGDQEGFPDDKVYCISYFRGIRVQQLIGYFLSDQLEPVYETSILSSFFPNTVQPTASIIAALISRSLTFLQCTDINSLLNKHR